jgi:translation initiation factor 2 gamma subunit (eIF-2gamma)
MATRTLGVIDVPGHEKFVHTMAAGASGIDHVLLVSGRRRRRDAADARTSGHRRTARHLGKVPWH